MATKKSEPLSIVDQFFLDNPQAPCLLKVNDTYLMQSAEGRAKALARLAGVEIEIIVNPNLKPA